MHKYGGVPSNGAVLPACDGCGSPLQLVLQVDLADPDLEYMRLDDWDYLFVLTCLNCASYEHLLYYRLEERGKGIVVLQQRPSVCVPEYPTPLDEHPASLRPLRRDEYPLTESECSHLLDTEGKHQLGGSPIWIQREERITCIHCSNQMEYIAMVDSELYVDENGFRSRGHMFGDEGTLYVFVCRACQIFAAKAQSL